MNKEKIFLSLLKERDKKEFKNSDEYEKYKEKRKKLVKKVGKYLYKKYFLQRDLINLIKIADHLFPLLSNSELKELGKFLLG